MIARITAAAAMIVALVSAADAGPWAWLGVRIRDLSEQEMNDVTARHGIREGFGVMIVEVLEDSPAAKSGLKNGDLVVAFDERPVTETRVLQRFITATGPERTAKLTVLRPAGRELIEVRLAPMPRAVVGERVAVEFGFVVREPEPAGPSTPAISVIIRRSPAERAGLVAGDVILMVNDRSVATREAVGEALADASLEAPLRLTVGRDGRRLSVVLKAPGTG